MPLGSVRDTLNSFWRAAREVYHQPCYHQQPSSGAFHEQLPLSIALGSWNTQDFEEHVNFGIRWLGQAVRMTTVTRLVLWLFI